VKRKEFEEKQISLVQEKNDLSLQLQAVSARVDHTNETRNYDSESHS